MKTKPLKSRIGEKAHAARIHEKREEERYLEERRRNTARNTDPWRAVYNPHRTTFPIFGKGES